jgi:hypothetical protein
MKRAEMRKKIDEELEHIPRVKGWLDQNVLRSSYNSMRAHDLSQNPICPAKDTLNKVIEEKRKDNPDFSPTYDRDFFEKRGG